MFFAFILIHWRYSRRNSWSWFTLRTSFFHQTAFTENVPLWISDSCNISVRYHFGGDSITTLNHQYSTRHCAKLKYPIILKESNSQRTYFFSTLKMYNTIPESIKNVVYKPQSRKYFRQYIYETFIALVKWKNVAFLFWIFAKQVQWHL